MNRRQLILTALACAGLPLLPQEKPLNKGSEEVKPLPKVGEWYIFTVHHTSFPDYPLGGVALPIQMIQQEIEIDWTA